MKIQNLVIASIFFTASALSAASSVISFGDGDKSAAPALLVGSLGLMIAGLVLAVVFKSRKNKA